MTDLCSNVPDSPIKSEIRAFIRRGNISGLHLGNYECERLPTGIILDWTVYMNIVGFIQKTPRHTSHFLFLYSISNRIFFGCYHHVVFFLLLLDPLITPGARRGGTHDDRDALAQHGERGYQDLSDGGCRKPRCRCWHGKWTADAAPRWLRQRQHQHKHNDYNTTRRTKRVT